MYAESFVLAPESRVGRAHQEGTNKLWNIKNGICFFSAAKILETEYLLVWQYPD